MNKVTEDWKSFARKRIELKISNFTEEILSSRNLRFGFNICRCLREFDLGIFWSFENSGVDQKIQRELDLKDPNLGLNYAIASNEDVAISISFNVSAKRSDGSLVRIVSDKSSGESPPDFRPIERSFKSSVSFKDLLDPSNNLLDDDNELNLQIEFELIDEVQWPAFNSAKKCAFKDQEKLVNSEKYSDFKIICSDNEVIHAHKVFLAVHCEVFEAMLDSKMSEKEKSEVRVDDVDSETMLELVRFMYSRKIMNIEDVNDRLLLAANKYGLEELEKMCVHSLMLCLTSDNVFDILRIADMLNKIYLRENCIDFIKFHKLQVDAGNVDTETEADSLTISDPHLLEREIDLLNTVRFNYYKDGHDSDF